MYRLSYKTFMDEVRQRLDRFSKEELRNLIMEWAAEEASSKRPDFLNKLKVDNQWKMPVTDTDTLMEEIEGFAKNVEDGDYSEGYGWDNELHEERDFGDESWAEEMDDFFFEARNLLREDNYKVAEEVYRKLFEILEMGEEPGHLPGNPDIHNMLGVDLGEHVALFLRSVYMNADSGDWTSLLYESMKEYGYLASPGIKLIDIRDSQDAPLPDFDEFLTDWIEFLKAETPSLHVSELLREAVFLKGGIPAISEFAGTYANKFPQAYMDWITALDTQGDTTSVLQVAEEGLSKIPGDYVVRAKVAEKLSEIGEERNDHKLKLKGLRESFYSNPSLKYLLDLYITAEEEGCFEEIRDEVEKRMERLRDEGSTRGLSFYDVERRHSAISEGDFIHALLLGGRYTRVFEMCKGKGPIGWSSSEHPKPVMLIFLMDVLSGENKYSKVLNDQWEYAVNRGLFITQEMNAIDKYKKIINRVKSNIHLTAEQGESYLKWCKNETGRRIDAIVSNQHRGSYHKAAKILVAMAETLANRGNQQEGHAFIDKYRNKYPRHSAFRREITSTLQGFGI